MNIQTVGLAKVALKQQVEIFGGDRVSLDSLWRAWASPAGLDPRSWSDLATPLLSGFAAYLERIGGEAGRDSDLSSVLWVWEDESKDPWCTGDLMSHEFIAGAYATYLDSRFAHRLHAAIPSLVCL